jgi:aspartate aminotransferase
MGRSNAISKLMESSSWIRAMFEESEKLKSVYGPENVFDFTLGNPIAEPPAEVKQELARIASSKEAGVHRYMTNSGYDDVRSQISEYLQENTGLPFIKDHIIMTVGAAGGINVVMKSILDPGDEVIVPSPFFVEFMFYIGNHGGQIKLVDTRDDFHLDIDAIEKAITAKTRAILINSPHNPTGTVYDQAELRQLADVLKQKKRQGQTIYLIADEAYRKIIYDSIVLPNIFALYDDAIMVTCHSKDLALPGERIGYIAISPRMENNGSLIDAMIFANRILGFINAPALMQRLVAKFQRTSVDIGEYQAKRDALYGILVEAGFDVIKPQGAFYIFAKSPIPDDIEFIHRLLEESHVLAVPGIGFGKKGYFRLAYCVEMDTIERSRDAFYKAGELYGLQRKASVAG